MKVLNIMTSALKYNGIGMSLLNYYKNIDSSKIQLDFLVPNRVEEKLKNEITKKGNNKLFELVSKNNNKMRQRQPLKYCIELYKILKKEKYDAVHIHGSSSMLILETYTARIAKCKTIIVHSRNTKSDYPMLDKLLRPFFKKSYTDAFACGKEAGEFLFSKNTQFTVIPNGKNSEEFEYNAKVREEYRKRYNINEKKVIGHVGNFTYQKNHEYLIDIFAQLTKLNPNYYLVLIGTGKIENETEIRNKVELLGLKEKVLFLGAIDQKEVSNWLQAMDIMVFTSRFEGFPNVLVEWQMAGLPCVISDKITKDVQLTRLVQFASIEEEPKKWVEIIENIKIEDREQSKKEILEQIKEKGFDIKENAKELEKLYYKLVEKNIKR